MKQAVSARCLYTNGKLVRLSHSGRLNASPPTRFAPDHFFDLENYLDISQLQYPSGMLP